MSSDQFLFNTLYEGGNRYPSELLISILGKAFDERDKTLLSIAGIVNIAELTADGISVKIIRSLKELSEPAVWSIVINNSVQTGRTGYIFDNFKMAIDVYAEAERILDNKVHEYNMYKSDVLDHLTVDDYNRTVGVADHIYRSMLYNIVLKVILSGEKFYALSNHSTPSYVSAQLVDGSYVTSTHDAVNSYESAMFNEIILHCKIPQILAVAIVRFLLA